MPSKKADSSTHFLYFLPTRKKREKMYLHCGASKWKWELSLFVSLFSHTWWWRSSLVCIYIIYMLLFFFFSIVVFLFVYWVAGKSKWIKVLLSGAYKCGVSKKSYNTLAMEHFPMFIHVMRVTWESWQQQQHSPVFFCCLQCSDCEWNCWSKSSRLGISTRETLVPGEWPNPG